LYAYMSVPASSSTPANISLEGTPLLIPKDQ
jgi:hypothetical protein